MSKCGIYKITNLINNKCYIGQSIHIETRWRWHKTNYRNKNEPTYDSHLYRSFRKYGIENFKFEVIEECEQDKLNEKEMYWIDYYDSYNNGYNETLGGGGKLQVDREEFKKYFIENNPSVKEIAEYFDIDRSVAGRIMKELGLKAKCYVSKEKEKEICNFYLSNPDFNLLDVSNEFNIDRDTASRVLKRNGIEVRRITANSLNRYKKILVYDLDGNFIKEDLLFDFRKWLYENGYTKDKSGRCVMRCLRGNGWQSNGFIVRWYKDNYPIKIKKTDYWDKNGSYQYKMEFENNNYMPRNKYFSPNKNKVKNKKLTKLKNTNEDILLYELNSGLFVRKSTFLEEVNEIYKTENIKIETIKNGIWNVLGGHKKSYKGYIFRHYIKNYPNQINVKNNWHNDYWKKECD